MHILLILTSAVAFITAFAVLMMGEWKNHWLKHSAMLLSSLTSGMITFILLTHNYGITVCTANDMMCANWFLYGIASNVRIILFHVAIARDVMDYKKYGNRRGVGRNVGWKGLT